MAPEPTDNAGESASRTNESMRSKGASAETKAIDYLVAQGYSIVERNYQIVGGEIDCIARDPDGTLVFVEVKASWSDAYGHPLFWVGSAKQKNLIRTAKRYLYDNDLYYSACRFDVIAVVAGNLEHLKNAFLA